MFCIDTQYTERYIDKHLYRYCVNHGGITANASSSKKGLDSYWICDVCVQCDVSRVTAMVLAGLPARS